jgi:hypothetical protein
MLNQSKLIKPTTVVGFDDLYKAEVAGVLSTQLRVVDELMPLVFAFGEARDGFGKNRHSDIVRAVTQMGLDLCAGRIRDVLPTVNILAALHARFRLDEARKYKPGDIEDLGHAAAALPYNNALFTENSLAHSLTTPPTDLATAYGTRVVSRMQDAIAVLENMG